MMALCQPAIWANDIRGREPLYFDARGSQSLAGRPHGVGDCGACGFRNRVLDNANGERRGRLGRALPQEGRYQHTRRRDRIAHTMRENADRVEARREGNEPELDQASVLGLNAAMPQ